MAKSTGTWLIFCFFLTSCATTSRLSRQANQLLQNPDLKNAHVGIAIFDINANRSLYNLQGNKYFIPASNTKLVSTYVALRHLGDSLVSAFTFEDDTALYILPAGDPTILHKDYSFQPLINKISSTEKQVYIFDTNWKEQALGAGWAWDDYNDDYMVERSALPVYGNVIRWVQQKDTLSFDSRNNTAVYSIPEVNWKVRFNPTASKNSFEVKRNFTENIFTITEGKESNREIEVPFVTNGIGSAMELLYDTTGKTVLLLNNKNLVRPSNPIRSQPIDSLLRPMLYRSDNFFAEQVLLMVSQQMLGEMNDAKIIDTILKSDLSSLPQKPKWVDGSGLSRYNQFSPDDFVWLLNSMQKEFGMDRLKHILPTGGEGTLLNYYKSDRGYIFAKTGSLSGQIAISGYLYTLRNKLLAFSVLVNNHNGSAGNIRRQVEAFLHEVRQKF